MSEEWDKAKKTLNAFISECNCMSSEDYKEAFASVAVGDKLLEEAEGHKARYDDLHRITMKWNRRLGAIHDIINRPNSKKTPSEEYASRLDEIEEALSLD